MFEKVKINRIVWHANICQLDFKPYFVQSAIRIIFTMTDDWNNSFRKEILLLHCRQYNEIHTQAIFWITDGVFEWKSCCNICEKPIILVFCMERALTFVWRKTRILFSRCHQKLFGCALYNLPVHANSFKSVPLLRFELCLHKNYEL